MKREILHNTRKSQLLQQSEQKDEAIHKKERKQAPESVCHLTDSRLNTPLNWLPLNSLQGRKVLL